MAVTGTIALSASTVQANQPFGVVLSLANGGAQPVNVLAITPRIQSTPLNATPAAVPGFSGQPNIPATNMSIAGGATNTYNYLDIIHGPVIKTGLANDLTPQLTAIGITSITQVGNLCTVTTSSAHGFPTTVPGPGQGLVVNITGNTISGSVPIVPAGYNGIFPIVAVPSTTTFTFNASTPNQAAGGAAGTCQLMGGWIYAIDAYVTFSDGTSIFATATNVTVLAPTF